MRILKTAVILAGGKSSRMNYNNKALLLLNEKAFIHRIIEALSNYDEIIIIANNNLEEYSKYNVKVFKDIYPAQGPLSGIHTALVHSKYDKCLVVACDMPLINKDIVNYLGSLDYDYNILIPKFNGKYEPLCGIYSKAIKSLVEERIKNKDNKLMKMCFEIGCSVIENFAIEICKLDIENNFENINTLQQYKSLLKKS